MKEKLIRFFGLNGSWKWSCRQLKKGKIIRAKNIAGTVRYKLDNESQTRILWAFPKRADPYGLNEKWDNAYIFLSDFERIDWEVVE